MGPGSQAALSAGGPPAGRADSHWLDPVVSGTAAAGQEEAFFWPENNTRVSPGTSLLHPLPSIVSAAQSQAAGLYAAWNGGRGGGCREQERLAMCVTPLVCLHFPGWARVLETADGQADQACVRGHRVPVRCKGLPAG